jgi:hypothetical protein
MKKKKVVRIFNFSDAVLITKGKEKIAFMQRDSKEFADFGITKNLVTNLGNRIDVFLENATDIEALSDQTGVTKIKDDKAETLRVAIREVMSRAELKYGTAHAKYKKFGTDTLSRQTDADLLITGKRVIRVGNTYLTELAEKGLTPSMLTAITTLCIEFENLVIDLRIKIGDRDVMQENRVEIANGIYATLVSYTNTGQSIWNTSNAAKFNDYVLYNTLTDEPVTPVI